MLIKTLMMPHRQRIPPKDKKNFGYLLEDKLLDALTSLQLFDKIMEEDHLKKIWGWAAAGIDHFLIIGDYAVAIQAKWRCTRRREDLGINNFLSSLEYTIAKSGKKLLVGLWVSRLEPFDDNKQRLGERNVLTISCFESIEDLVAKTKDAVAKAVNTKLS